MRTPGARLLETSLPQQLDELTQARGQRRVVGLESDRERLETMWRGSLSGYRVSFPQAGFDVGERRTQHLPGLFIQPLRTRQLVSQ